jgi:DNA-binding LytR/AlgR family response regulator
MIKIAIIEDEIPAREKLKRFIKELKMDSEIVAEIGSVDAAVAFLNTITVDLIISDIELQDGNAFEIYQQVSLSCPIIFTTAYDQFWINAFESNGIDYLLKPFSKDRFQKAWTKFLMLKNSPNDNDIVLSNLTKIIEQNFTQKLFKKRFNISHRQEIYFLDTENITLFEANSGLIFAHDITGKKHMLTESTLKEIEDKMNPSLFFRINRSEIVNKNHIEKIENHNKNALAVKLKGSQKYLSTSQSNTASFRIWLEQ